MLNRAGKFSRGLTLAVMLLAGSIPWSRAAAPAAHSAVFDTNCSMCHQLGAVGVAGQFPRLAGRAGRIAATPAGRSYLEHVVLYGMMGTITVDHTQIVGGVMPSFSALSNEDLAAALNYVANLDAAGKLHWEGPVVTAAQIAKVRAGKVWSPMQVHQLRETVLGKKRS